MTYSSPFAILPRASRLVISRQPGDTTSRQPLAVQAVVGLLGADGTAVTDEQVNVHAYLSGSAPGVVLSGTRDTFTVLGSATFTDLMVTLPSSLSSASVLITFESMVGPPELRSTLDVESRALLVLHQASTLRVSIQPEARNPAGEPLGDIPVEMFDTGGLIVTKSNVVVNVVVLDYFGKAASAPPTQRELSGTTSRLCIGGVANFDDLHISFASGNYSLFFTAPAMSLTVESRFFSVEVLNHKPHTRNAQP